MLYVKADKCLISANYYLDGFAVTFAFEPVDSDYVPPPDLDALPRDLSVDCLNAGGRIHFPKNSHVDPTIFRKMFGDQGSPAAPRRPWDPGTASASVPRLEA